MPLLLPVSSSALSVTRTRIWHLARTPLLDEAAIFGKHHCPRIQDFLVACPSSAECRVYAVSYARRMLVVLDLIEEVLLQGHASSRVVGQVIS